MALKKIKLPKFKDLRFGTAGIPLQCEKCDVVKGIEFVRKELNLGSFELEFVYGINIKKENAENVRKAAKENDVLLSCHGPYYINLNAKEIAKRKRSKHLLLSSAVRAYECGAFSITFHPGYYLKMPKDVAYKNVKQMLEEIVEELKEKECNILVAPETTGKISQFGTLEEIINLAKEIDGIVPCIDFGHLHAKTLGKLNDFNGFCKVFETIEKELGKKYLSCMHIQVTGIEFTEKGERRHLPLKESSLNYKELMKAFKHYEIKGTVICESPLIEKDALLMKKYYDSL